MSFKSTSFDTKLESLVHEDYNPTVLADPMTYKNAHLFLGNYQSGSR